MSIQKELDRLEALILDSTHLPLGKTIINEEEALDILDRVRENLPKEFEEADRLLKSRDALIAQTKQQAQQLRDQAQVEREQVLASAKRDAERFLNESELLKVAQEEALRIRTQSAQELENYKLQAEAFQQQTRTEADQILAGSRAEAKRVQEAADDYADRVLGELEDKLERFLQIVKAGRQQLKKE